MSAKSIREYDGKAVLAYWLNRSPSISKEEYKTVSATPAVQLAQIQFPLPTLVIPAESTTYREVVEDVFAKVEQEHPWVKETKLVAKPDQLIKRRGKSGLLKLNATWDEAKEWIRERAGKNQKVQHAVGYLTTFLVEPFVPHPPNTEYYININSVREGDWILFCNEGGVDVGDVDAKARKLLVPVRLSEFPSRATIASTLLSDIPVEQHESLVDFIIRLYSVYVDCQFTYLEINPLVVIPTAKGADVFYLDLAAKLDQTAEFECGAKWAVARAPESLGIKTSGEESGAINADHGPPMVFPAPFGRELSKEEAYVQGLDAKTGASLKLTILNAEGRVWNLVAGGGASVVYADAVAVNGAADELANYGEYSGAPTDGQTYEYAKTVLDLMTRGEPRADGKVLFIGGGIANFTSPAVTFRAIARALGDYKDKLHAHKVSIWVRRAGPNYQEGLRVIREAGKKFDLPLKVYGPECHISGIVPMGLGKAPVEAEWQMA
ncbi:ATP citrate synthase [Schizosaccharomyces pombe]|uniref:Probable ATP-citrate synthase subunit 2 n=1 Tax=Schizosaccharomyces pombe (strain 972 / ATCC 24843) TaxID=284812 RepID=ACL2_SCHPO|nr:putative ATP-citrate synthase subunit 2 [Schizosaccharomyces pombe]O13907.1 RecName: Full=Probable ATP-citrate synthase subunit 2; AltName: Full=ATP-citrate (pro-S-)-lyase 2; AltName: Full=Citrate cleavage enzyme subunit 2 [Schizosaccharomyces pombe 972h-]CAB16586.1 ATP-citrate synthase subunit 2 (predicted) [Schizosaccharomyces pombe]|eukprot:NP_593246.1 putative ATP-citrate synthase subunit 2 [Schizosaccharomyces pombe]